MKRYFNAGKAGGPTTQYKHHYFSPVYVTTESVPQPQSGNILMRINNTREELNMGTRSRDRIAVHWEGNTTGLNERTADIMYIAILGQFPRTAK